MAMNPKKTGTMSESGEGFLPEKCEGKKCCHHDFGKKILMTLFGVLMIYLTFYLGTLMRNNVKKYETIGRADKMERTVTVVGNAKVTAKNNIAITTIGFTNIDLNLDKARSDNNKVMDALMADIKNLNIDEKDLQSNFTINPENDYTPKGSIFKGYRVTNNLTLKIRDLSKITEVLALAGKHGANQVTGLQFTIDDPEDLKVQARNKAVLDAKQKAAQLAGLLNVKLGDLVSYSDYENAPVYGMKEGFGMGGFAAPASVAPNAVSSGSQDIYMNVSLTYSISPQAW